MIFDKGDVVNFGALTAICVLVFLIITHTAIAFQSENPTETIKDVTQWAVPILLGILQTYGILKMKRSMTS